MRRDPKAVGSAWCHPWSHQLLRECPKELEQLQNLQPSIQKSSLNRSLYTTSSLSNLWMHKLNNHQIVDPQIPDTGDIKKMWIHKFNTCQLVDPQVRQIDSTHIQHGGLSPAGETLAIFFRLPCVNISARTLKSQELPLVKLTKQRTCTYFLFAAKCGNTKQHTKMVVP